MAVVLVGALCFVANVAYGLTSFGPAIIFQCGWHAAYIFFGDVVSGEVSEVRRTTAYRCMFY